MSKARKTLKFSSAVALSTVYGLALHRMLTHKEPQVPLDPAKAVATVSVLTGLTWLATIL